MKNEKFGIGISIDYDKETGLTYVSKVHSQDLKDIVEFFKEISSLKMFLCTVYKYLMLKMKLKIKILI